MGRIQCDNCGKSSSLTEIVNKDLIKSEYLCIDCGVENINTEYDPFNTGHYNKTPIQKHKISKLFKFMFGVSLMLILMSLGVMAEITEIINYTPNQQGCSYTDDTGIRIRADTSFSILGVNKTTGSTATRLMIYDDTPTLLGNTTFPSDYGEFEIPIEITKGSYYRIVTDKSGAQYCFTDENPPSTKPVAGTLYNVTHGYYDQWSSDNYIRGILSITFDDSIEVIFPSQNPLNSTGLNQNTNLYYNVSSETNCNISVNGTIKTELTATTGLNNFTYLTSWGTEGNNEILINCTGYTNSSTYFVDTTEPVYNYVNGVQYSDSLNFNINGSIIDENFYLNISTSDNFMLWSVNVSMGNASQNDINYNNYTENILSTNFMNTELVNLGSFEEGSEEIWIEVCDGHTANKIPDYKITKKSYGVQINDYISITTDVNISIFDLIKQTDRYNFFLDFINPVNEFEIEVESIQGVNYIDSSIYPGHLITDKYWIDFQNENFYIDQIIQETTNKVVIKFKSNNGLVQNGVIFNSIGSLNCVDYNGTFIVDQDTDTVNLTTPTNNFQINITESNTSVLFKYIPYYNPTGPDNCSIWINGTINQTDLTITKNIENEFNISFNDIEDEQTRQYLWKVSCSEDHFHPPSTYEEHIKTSETYTLNIFNENTLSTTSTTTTTTTTIEGSTNVNVDLSGINRTFTQIFLFTAWFLFIYLTYKVKPNGKTVGIFGIMNLIFGLAFTFNIIAINFMIGFASAFASISMFVGMMLYDR